MSEAGDWVDCTNILLDAAKEMAPGTMIHSDCFNLFEAMSALELMDPKMDAGSNSEDVTTPEERLESGMLYRIHSLLLSRMLF